MIKGDCVFSSIQIMQERGRYGNHRAYLSGEYLECALPTSHGHAADLGRVTSPPMRDLMLAVADRFSSQDPPLTLVELDKRSIQSVSACAIIGSVSHTNEMARFLPEPMSGCIRGQRFVLSPRPARVGRRVPNARAGDVGVSFYGGRVPRHR
jgi:hypothetical protein